MHFRRELRLNEVDKEIRAIWNSYNTFQSYQENKDSVSQISSIKFFFFFECIPIFQLEESTLIDFAQNINGHHGDSIRSRLDNLHSLVAPEKGGGILGNKGVMALFATGMKVSCEF